MPENVPRYIPGSFHVKGATTSVALNKGGCSSFGDGIFHLQARYLYIAFGASSVVT